MRGVIPPQDLLQNKLKEQTNEGVVLLNLRFRVGSLLRTGGDGLGTCTNFHVSRKRDRHPEGPKRARVLLERVKEHAFAMLLPYHVGRRPPFYPPLRMHRMPRAHEEIAVS